jgi:NAD(P)-dependent dehydrogenase (short-subunit alcohol dehydrogenase family)
MTVSPALGNPGTGVVVTGGASGIGLASAEALAAVGRAVALWDINGDKATGAAERIAAEYGVKAVGIQVDLRDPAAIAPALEASRAGVGALGGLVHAAGTVDTASIDGLTVESWDAGMAVHLRSFAFVTQAIHADLLARDGIRINSVSPGQILTPMMQPAIDALPEGFFEKRILLERIGDPMEIGRVVRFLLSDEASYITASEVVVDGGNISSQRG